MLRCISKTQFENQEHNTQNSIALLNYLKRIAPQSFHTKMFESGKNAAQLFEIN
jgi:hypothetical protein